MFLKTHGKACWHRRGKSLPLERKEEASEQVLIHAICVDVLPLWTQRGGAESTGAMDRMRWRSPRRAGCHFFFFLSKLLPQSVVAWAHGAVKSEEVEAYVKSQLQLITVSGDEIEARTKVRKLGRVPSCGSGKTVPWLDPGGLVDLDFECRA